MSMPRRSPCAVAGITDHGDRVYTVDLEPAVPVPAFRPGQFLHLTVDDYDPAGFWPESRVFSIASSPKHRDRLRLCYAVKGRYTARMEAELVPGRAVWVKLPYGDFVIDSSQDAVLLAGGTGLTAFTAFLENLEPDPCRSVFLAYGARTPALFLFQDLLRARLETVPGFSVLFFAETPDPGFSEAVAGWPRSPRCLAGRLDAGRILQELNAGASRAVYLSGPPAMLTALTMDLRAKGVPAGQIRIDAWE